MNEAFLFRRIKCVTEISEESIYFVVLLLVEIVNVPFKRMPEEWPLKFGKLNTCTTSPIKTDWPFP